MIKLIKKLFRWLYRSAVNGRWVTKEYAEAHPDTTTKERTK